MLGSIGWPELILILLVVLLVFGVGRITKVGGELGAGIRAFKEGLSEDKEEQKPEVQEKPVDHDLPKSE
ncbi:MAG: twin-arginine translocase TatA/TatE family subunit [Anaerolineaceae bacterium]